MKEIYVNGKLIATVSSPLQGSVVLKPYYDKGYRYGKEIIIKDKK